MNGEMSAEASEIVTGLIEKYAASENYEVSLGAKGAHFSSLGVCRSSALWRRRLTPRLARPTLARAESGAGDQRAARQEARADLALRRRRGLWIRHHVQYQPHAVHLLRRKTRHSHLQGLAPRRSLDALVGLTHCDFILSMFSLRSFRSLGFDATLSPSFRSFHSVGQAHGDDAPRLERVTRMRRFGRRPRGAFARALAEAPKSCRCGSM